jgi:hypothetical protein
METQSAFLSKKKQHLPLRNEMINFH